jgi:hypothetical protein
MCGPCHFDQPAHHIIDVVCRTSIADVLAKFLVQRNIRIKDFADVNEQQPVWSRHRFFSALLHVNDFSMPVARIHQRVRPIPCVPASTLVSVPPAVVLYSRCVHVAA